MEHEVTRTLVKSQPEVWAQCSVAESLERHTRGSFGEIRITRLEPEHSVAWEGEKVRGTVKIEPSAWGTRVTIAVETEDEAAPPPLTAAASHEAKEPVETHSSPEPSDTEPATESPAEASGRQPGRFSRWWARLRRQPVTEPEAQPETDEGPGLVPDLSDEELLIQDARQEIERQELSAAGPLDEAAARTDPEPASPAPAEAALSAALESLGQAHHRPFSRA